MLQEQTTAGFTFLSPLIKNATPSGTFNPDLRPVLEVCSPLLAECTRLLTTGDQSTGITLDAAASEYKALWKFAGGAPEYPAGDYQFTVYASAGDGAKELGSVDVVFDGSRVTSPDGQVISENGTIPVKFFIARYSLCSTREIDTETEPCLEMVVGSDGGTFVTDTKLAGAYFAPGAIPPGTFVTLIIEKYEPPAPGEEAEATEFLCIPTDDLQYEGCYVFRTEPKISFTPREPGSSDPYFKYGVVVGICPVTAAIPLAEQGEMELWKWDEEDPDTKQPLEVVDVGFLECESQGLAAASTGWGRQLLQPLAQVFLPSPLHARKISPFGGGLNDFSRIGWVRPLALTKTAGDGQAGYPDYLLPVDPQVRVTSAVQNAQVNGRGVAGIDIDFLVTSGEVIPSSQVTDADGYVSATWRLGTENLNTLTVTGPKPVTFPNSAAAAWGTVQFTANGIPLPPPPPTANYTVIFTNPVASGKLTKNQVNVPGVPVTVQVCPPGGGACTEARRQVDGNMYGFQWRSPSDGVVGNYALTVREGTKVLRTLTGAVGKAGSKPPRGVDFVFELGSTVPIKFYLVAK